MVLTDGQGRSDIEKIVEQVLIGGGRTIHLREKTMAEEDLLPLAKRLRELTRLHGASLIINHHVDLAEVVDADGIHLGWRSKSVSEVRDRLGKEKRIGVSTHTLEEAIAAGDCGADYVFFGPVFATPSKEGLVAPQGVDRLRECVHATECSVIAIGGIFPENLPLILQTGVAGVAVIRSVLDAPDPRAATERYLRLFKQGGEYS